MSVQPKHKKYSNKPAKRYKRIIPRFSEDLATLIISFLLPYRCDPPPRCTDKCNTNKDCEVREGYKEFCKEGHCYYVGYGCRSDSDCEPGLTCHKQRCIKTACSTNQQCSKTFGKQAFCVKGKCLENLEICESNNHCMKIYGSKFRCYSGTCAKVNMKLTKYLDMLPN